MLTATYSLIAMETEQSNATNFLATTRQTIAALWVNMQDVDSERIQTALAKLTKLDQYFHHRKVEKFVIPAIRGVSSEIDAIIDDVEALTNSKMNTLNIAAEELKAGLEKRTSQLWDLYDAMEDYCESLQLRLQREQKELLPLVQRVLSVDDWFALAAQFLSDQKEQRHPPRWFGRGLAPAA
jgi:hemerythrin-like domain-containing protein